MMLMTLQNVALTRQKYTVITDNRFHDAR